MKFIKFDGDYVWNEFDEANLLARNLVGGYRKIDKNSFEYINSTIIEAENWHDLHLKTGWLGPWVTIIYPHAGWLTPDGLFYQCNAHDIDAVKIVEFLYGKYMDTSEAADFLTQRGWLKITTSLMWDIRLEEENKWYLTPIQEKKLFEWCHAMDMEFPKGKIERRFDI